MNFWTIHPSEPGAIPVPYGYVTDIWDWPDWELGEVMVPGCLMVGAPHQKSWREAVEVLTTWNDFVWSDDDFPWITPSGVDELLTSRLTGFRLERMFVAEVLNTVLVDVPRQQLPILFRMIVPELPADHSIVKAPDFFRSERTGRYLTISEKALNWLRSNSWTNYCVTPIDLSE